MKNLDGTEIDIFCSQAVQRMPPNPGEIAERNVALPGSMRCWIRESAASEPGWREINPDAAVKIFLHNECDRHQGTP